MVKCEVKFCLLFLQIILVSNAVYFEERRNVTESSFSYIGSYKEPDSKARCVNEADYYVSANPATWANALADCKTVFGRGVNIVAIETEGEWRFLKKHLEYFSGTRYWTSGTFDPSSNVWRWTANGEPLPYFAPWAKGYPNNPRSVLCVLIYRVNQFDASWRTEVKSRMERFICEVQAEEIPTASNNNEISDGIPVDTIPNNNDLPDDKVLENDDLPVDALPDNNDLTSETVLAKNDLPDDDKVLDNDVDTVPYNNDLTGETVLAKNDLPGNIAPNKNELSEKDDWMLWVKYLFTLLDSDEQFN